MRPILPTLLALAASGLLAPAAAVADPLVGVSLGAALTNPQVPGSLDSYQSSQAFTLRSQVGSPFTELGLGVTSRGQTLSPDKTYVFETSGLKLDGGVRFGPVRTGVGLELSLLRQIVVQPGGTLRFHNGAGPIVEPYVAVRLPWWSDEDSFFEVSAHYPLPQARVDPAVGPRLLVTWWVDGSKGPDEEAPAEGEAVPPSAPAARPAPPSGKPAPRKGR